MTEANKKIAQTIAIIVGVVIAAIGVQFARFRIKISELELNQGAVLPANFFPFNGTYIKDNNGKITKS